LYIGKLSNFKHHRSIETLPIWNYNQVKETESFKYLYAADPLDYYDIKEEPDFGAVWEKLNREFLDFFGFSPEFERMLRQERAILIMECRLLQTGDRTIKNLIRAKQNQMDSEDPTEKMRYEKIVDLVERHRKVVVDQHRTSVKMFYTYVKGLSEQS